MKIKVGERWLIKLHDHRLKEVTILEISPSNKYYKTEEGWREYPIHVEKEYFHELLSVKKDINN